MERAAPSKPLAPSLGLQDALAAEAGELYEFGLPLQEVERLWDAAVSTLITEGRDGLMAYVAVLRGRLELIDLRIDHLQNAVRSATSAEELRAGVIRLWYEVRDGLNDGPSTHAMKSGSRDTPNQDAVPISAKALKWLSRLASSCEYESGLQDEIVGLVERRDVIRKDLQVLNAVLYEDVVYGRVVRWSDDEDDVFPELEGTVRERLRTFIDIVLEKHRDNSEVTPTSISALFPGKRGFPTLDGVWDRIASRSLKANGESPKGGSVRDLFSEAPNPWGSGNLFEAGDTVEALAKKLLPFVVLARLGVRL